MELKEDMYVRTKLTDFCNLIAIRRIIEIDKDANEIWLDDDVIDDYGELYNTVRKEDIDKASNYIIDLIEVGDLIETPKGIFQVGYIENNVIYTGNSKVIACLREDEHLCFENTTITSIVTKEQFEIQKYYVESE